MRLQMDHNKSLTPLLSHCLLSHCLLSHCLLSHCLLSRCLLPHCLLPHFLLLDIPLSYLLSALPYLLSALPYLLSALPYLLSALSYLLSSLLRTPSPLSSAAAHLMKAAYGDDTVTSITHHMTHRSMLKDLHASGQEKVPEGDSMGGSALNKVTARVLLDTPTSGTPVDRTGTPVDSFGTPDGTGGGNLADGGGSLFDSNPSPARSILNLGSELQFATTVAVGKARLSFGSQRCVSVPKKARGKGAQVWWNGRGGSGGAGSSSAAAGFACSQVKFFGKDGCQGAALDRMVNPGAAAAKFPSTKKNLRKRASVASVLSAPTLLAIPVTRLKSHLLCFLLPRHALQVANAWWMRQASATASGPGGKCVVDETGERYCQWGDSPLAPLSNSPLAPLPHSPLAPLSPLPHSPHCLLHHSRFVKFGQPATVTAYSATFIVNRTAPLLAPLPPLHPMLPFLCRSFSGQPATVTAYSATFIVNRNADDNSSRPYTFRLNLNGCTQYPDAVAGRFTAAYIVDNIDDAPRCPSFNLYSTDNCEDDRDYQDKSESSDPFAAGYALDMLPMPYRSAWCTE
ncbi:unnamed protein product [Closterium sp. NIES-65]|nr:unnamed protein product [Closterium sp. NIES-65]